MADKNSKEAEWLNQLGLNPLNGNDTDPRRDIILDIIAEEFPKSIAFRRVV